MTDESPLPASARTVTRHIAADLYATDGTGHRTVPGPVYVVEEAEVAPLLTALAEAEHERDIANGHLGFTRNDLKNALYRAEKAETALVEAEKELDEARIRLASLTPNDGVEGRPTVLNAYGRQCYNAGREAALADHAQAVQTLATELRTVHCLHTENGEGQFRCVLDPSAPRCRICAVADRLDGLAGRETP